MNYEPESLGPVKKPEDVTLDSIAQNARDAVNKLAEQIEYLGSRLGPILRDAEPSDSHVSLLAAPVGTAPLTLHLTDTVHAIEACQRQVDGILNRVDLLP